MLSIFNEYMHFYASKQPVAQHLTGDMRSSVRSGGALLLITFLFSTGTDLHAGGGASANDLHRLIDQLFTKKVAARAVTSVKIISAETGDVLYERNAHTPLTPASTLKLISSAAALVKLGRDYAFRTVISTDDMSHAGSIVRGNIYLQGFGDPYLNVEDLRKLASDLQKQGIREVVGDVVGDESYFDHESACSDLSGRECVSNRLPHLSALTVNLSQLQVTLYPGKMKGTKVRVESPIGIGSFKLVNECITVNERVRYRPTVKARWNKDGCTLRIVGRMSVGSRPRTYSFPVRSPAWFAAAVFREQLRLEGITVLGETRVGAAPVTAKELTRSRSPLYDVLTTVNKESDNFAAEMVLRTLAAKLIGPPGSVEKGVLVLEQFLEEDVGIPQVAFHVHDGSGLSHQNAVSADALTKLLRYMYTRKDLFETFRMTLPSAGVDGTLRGRMIGTEAEGKLQAKTGSLNGVTSLAGYVTNADNELLVFSITSADAYYGKKRYQSLQDKIGALLAGFSRNRPSTN